MSRKKLKIGFSTGTAATAAAQAALIALLTGQPVDRVKVYLPEGGDIDVTVADTIPDRAGGRVEATVIKDAGDDPDVTHRAKIKATVARIERGPEEAIIINGGVGVGRVTRPGLPVPVGEAAINPVPRQMILDGLKRIWKDHHTGPGPMQIEVTISVPEGERLALKTLNPRLGIVGGLSILGTTGLVKPFSHEAYTATIDSALSVARAVGLEEVVLTTGGRSEKRAMTLWPDLPETGFVQIADFFGYALNETRKRGFPRVGLVSFFGKAVKQAQGLEYTHAHKAPLDLAYLAEWLGEENADPDLIEQVSRANTARHALTVLQEAGAQDLVRVVGRRMLISSRTFIGPEPEIRVFIIDYDGTVMFEDYSSGETC